MDMFIILTEYAFVKYHQITYNKYMKLTVCQYNQQYMEVQWMNDTSHDFMPTQWWVTPTNTVGTTQWWWEVWRREKLDLYSFLMTKFSEAKI